MAEILKNRRRCKTPGAIYTSKSQLVYGNLRGKSTRLDFSVYVPWPTTITKSRMKILQREFHRTLEKYLAPVWGR